MAKFVWIQAGPGRKRRVSVDKVPRGAKVVRAPRSRSVAGTVKYPDAFAKGFESFELACHPSQVGEFNQRLREAGINKFQWESRGNEQMAPIRASGTDAREARREIVQLMRERS